MMNDFTKEELLSISECLRMAYKSGFDTTDDLPDAYHCYDKIQSMIDTCCEHKNDVWPLYTSTGDLPSGAFCYDCNKTVDVKFINE